jgi:hypothetical protein
MAKIVELNKVASRKTGEIEAQCKLTSELESLENGAIMLIEATTDTIVPFGYSAKENEVLVDAMYLHFSNPRRYEDGKTGMENFIYTRSEKYLPRLYKLTSGDIFTTDYDLTAVVAAGRIAVLDAKATLPNGKAGKSYRVIK